MLRRGVPTFTPEPIPSAPDFVAPRMRVHRITDPGFQTLITAIPVSKEHG